MVLLDTSDDNVQLNHKCRSEHFIFKTKNISLYVQKQLDWKEK